MAEYKLGEVEMKFASIVWDNEPIKSGELAKLCEKELGWKKSTTYTVLKRLCGKEIFQNDQGTVTSLVSYGKFRAVQSEQFVDEAFAGSLPGFVAAFCSRKKLSREEASELKRIIDNGINNISQG